MHSLQSGSKRRVGGGGVVRGTLEAESEGGASEWEIKGGGTCTGPKEECPK